MYVCVYACMCVVRLVVPNVPTQPKPTHPHVKHNNTCVKQYRSMRTC